MREKIVISLNQKEQLKLEQILTDDDEKEALEFLRKVIKEKIDKANQEGCKPIFEWKTEEPSLLNKMKEKAKNKNQERRQEK